MDWPSVEFPKGSVGIVSRVRHYGEEGQPAPSAFSRKVRRASAVDQPIHSLISGLLRTRAHHTLGPGDPVLGGSCCVRTANRKVLKT